ncbi:hypothetical protein [Rhizobium sp. YTU87027]|uniref:hypothetical protein n=1 Tax=Rhizobium sp. YTU87027 TaxID=3417741 RepID=UPI003D690F6F
MLDYQNATLPAAGKERLLGSNTNLERISEWLTTMLVGVGLTEVDSLGDRFRDFSDFLAERVMIFRDGSSSAGFCQQWGRFFWSRAWSAALDSSIYILASISHRCSFTLKKY